MSTLITIFQWMLLEIYIELIDFDPDCSREINLSFAGRQFGIRPQSVDSFLGQEMFLRVLIDIVRCPNQ